MESSKRSAEGFSGVLSQQKLQELVREIDPKQVLDEDVEELLMQMADDFIEGVVTSACKLAKHRKSSTVETKDLQLHLGKKARASTEWVWYGAVYSALCLILKLHVHTGLALSLYIFSESTSEMA